MYKLGIDVGGTNVAVGVVDENYNICGRSEIKTNAGRPAEDIIDDIAKVAIEAIKDAGVGKDEIECSGIGVPGSIDPKEKSVIFSNNLRFNNLPICRMLKERTGYDFYIENDANAAAYGEYIAGAGKGTENFIAITLGTGVGGGVIIDGKIYSGSNHAGAELGHTVICIGGERCTCGRHGCFEAYASATALIRQTKQAMIRYPDSIMWELCDRDISKISGKTAFDAMRKGDVAGKYVVDQYINYVAVGTANIVNIFQPDVICIGGGISKEGKTLIDPINEFVAGENYARNNEKKAKIMAATLGNDAGIIGAAYLCNLYR